MVVPSCASNDTNEVTMRRMRTLSIGQIKRQNNLLAGRRDTPRFPAFDQGEMAEWSNAVVLKTIEPKGSGGSNPSLSATFIDLWH